MLVSLFTAGPRRGWFWPRQQTGAQLDCKLDCNHTCSSTRATGPPRVGGTKASDSLRSECGSWLPSGLGSRPCRTSSWRMERGHSMTQQNIICHVHGKGSQHDTTKHHMPCTAMERGRAVRERGPTPQTRKADKVFVSGCAPRPAPRAQRTCLRHNCNRVLYILSYRGGHPSHLEPSQRQPACRVAVCRPRPAAVSHRPGPGLFVSRLGACGVGVQGQLDGCGYAEWLWTVAM